MEAFELRAHLRLERVPSLPPRSSICLGMWARSLAAPSQPGVRDKTLERPATREPVHAAASVDGPSTRGDVRQCGVRWRDLMRARGCSKRVSIRRIPISSACSCRACGPIGCLTFGRVWLQHEMRLSRCRHFCRRFKLKLSALLPVAQPRQSRPP